MYMETEQLITSPDVGPLRFDSDGFLIDPEMWTRGLARHIAEAEGGSARWATRTGASSIMFAHAFSDFAPCHPRLVSAVTSVLSATLSRVCLTAAGNSGASPVCRIRARRQKRIWTESSDSTMRVKRVLGMANA
jgi:hypothetical protein